MQTVETLVKIKALKHLCTGIRFTVSLEKLYSAALDIAISTYTATLYLYAHAIDYLWISTREIKKTDNFIVEQNLRLPWH